MAATSRANRGSHSVSCSQPNSSSQETGSSSSSAVSNRLTNPFITNPHGHPSFSPVKLGARGLIDSKTPKQPKPPDKPLMPYLRYSRKVWDSVKASNPDLKLWEIGKIIGQMWRELSDDEKQEYVDEYEIEKVQYADAMKAYHNSPAYQSWIAAKGKADVIAEPEEPEKTRRSKAPSSSHQAEPKMVNIQPTDDEEDLDDTPSVKHIAASRYHHNHCLINDIFSDAIVPDGRTVINETRMTVLKRQVQSLTVHQKKLEGELQQLEEKHKSKKLKFAENSEQFYQEYRKLCESKPQISDEQFNAMVCQAKEELKEKQKNLATKESEGDNKQKLEDELPQRDEENAMMDTLDSVVLTKQPPSQEANSNGTQGPVEEKSKENDCAEVVVNSETQYSTNTGSHNDDQRAIPAEKTSVENPTLWKEMMIEADSAAILSDITEDSVDEASTDESSRKPQ